MSKERNLNNDIKNPMKAIFYTKYGPPNVLKIKEIEKPIPKDNEMLIKIYAATVTSGDVRMRSGKFPSIGGIGWLGARLYFGLRKPKKNLLGTELSGQIEAVGRNIKRFKIGDQVFGTATMWHSGAYAEYICMPEERKKEGMIALKPSNMTYDEAAAVPVGANMALHFLRKANIQSEQKVLIYGASGSVGTYAVQLAKYFGAKVTGVCSNTNLELVKSLGAEKVIDYTKEDFSKDSETYDVIFDTVNKASFLDCKKVLKKKGIFIEANPRLLNLIRGSGRSTKIIVGNAIEKNENLEYLKELIEENEIKAVIDRTYPMEQIVEAHRYVDKGHKKGNVVITVNNNLGGSD